MRPLDWPGRLACALIRCYRHWISPLLPPTCRYTPTCSEYALEAITRHGLLRGGWLGLCRLMRCHPFGGHGLDPVPGRCGAPSVDLPTKGSSDTR